MELNEIRRLLILNLKWLIIVPVLLGSSILFFKMHGQKRTYISDTTIYTGIASGYSITGNAELDYYATSTAFDNLIALIDSRETKEEVAIRLLATHIWLEVEDLRYLNASSYENLKKVLPKYRRDHLRGPDIHTTYNNVLAYYKNDYKNEVYKLLNSEEDFYSFKALSNIVPSRIKDSDVIKVEYQTTDAAICKHTLELLTEVFIHRNRVLRERETNSVVDYYEGEAKSAYQKLEDAEQRFLDFNNQNQIINFAEQSKNISSHREALYTDYTEVEMLYVAAMSALSTIEEKLANRSMSTLSSNELLDLRSRITGLNTRLVDIELLGKTGEGKPVSQQSINLKAELEETSSNISQKLSDYYNQTHSIGGIPSQGLLDEWIKNVILVEEGAAKLQVMDKRKKDFLTEYQRMAPLGAALNQIEREIQLAEKEYLSILGSLNSSRLTQQNIALTAQLNIVDPPYLPVKPESSKTIFMVLLGAIGGFVSVVGIVLAREFLDNNIKNASNASEMIGLRVAGVLPLISKDYKVDSFITEDKSLADLARHLIFKSTAIHHSGPFVVGFISTLKGEGKTTAIQKLKKKLNAINVATVSYHPQPYTVLKQPKPENTIYYLPHEFSRAKIEGSEDDWFDGGDNQIVLIEFPPVSDEVFPYKMITKLDLVLVTVRSNRQWLDADKRAINSILDQINVPAEILVTGVLKHHCVEYLGHSTY